MVCVFLRREDGRTLALDGADGELPVENLLGLIEVVQTRLRAPLYAAWWPAALRICHIRGLTCWSCGQKRTQEASRVRRLVYQGVELAPHLALSHYGVKAGSTLYELQRLRGGMPASAPRIKMPANNRMHSSAALRTTDMWSNVIGLPCCVPAKSCTAHRRVSAVAPTDSTFPQATRAPRPTTRVLSQVPGAMPTHTK